MWMQEKENGKFKYYERYRDPYTEKWKQVTVTLDSGSNRAKKEAQKILDEKIEKALNQLETSGMLSTAFLEEWWGFYKKGIKNSSISSLTSNFNHLKETFGTNVPIRNIDTKYIQNYLNQQSDLSRSKLERLKTLLNIAFDYATDLEYIKDNPARKARLPKLQKTIEDYRKTESKFLEEDELSAILAELYRRPSTYRLALLAEFMAYNGCRMGEAISIKPENIDFESKTVDIHGTLDKTVGYSKGSKTTPKTSASWRTVLLSERELAILKEIMELNDIDKHTVANHQDLGFVFTTKRGIPIQNNSFNLALKRANERLEKPIEKNLTSHIFRHTLVSRLAEYNVPLKAIMQRVGHSDSKTTMNIYTHVTQNMETNVVSLLNKLST